MRTLIIGDQFIPAASYQDALAERSSEELELSTVDWSGTKAEQHHIQQVMEQHGPNAVTTPAELLDAVGDTEALGLHFAPVGKELIAAAPNLKVIAVARSGLENVDIDAATAAGVGVVASHGRNAGAVAELQLGLILAEARNIARADASVKAGEWRKDFPGNRIELARRTVGMVGFGHVGATFARRVSGFEATLVVYDPYVSDEVLAQHGAQRAHTLNEVFAGSDFVLVQARLTPQTERFITAEQFALMPPHAYFINVSRSRLVDYDALYEALAAGRISGAGLDVFDEEPLTADSRWRHLDNVTITTHFGGDTEDTNRVSAALVTDALSEFARSGKIARAANARELGWT